MCVAPIYMPSSEYYVLHKGPTNETWLAVHKTGRYSDVINKSAFVCLKMALTQPPKAKKLQIKKI